MLRIKRVLSAVAALALTLMLTVIMPVAPANAAVIRAFTPHFQTQTNGAITITGNGLLACPATDATCVTAQTNPLATKGNNDFNMGFIDLDGDATTRNSSSANVAVPAGSRILYAGLFWGAATTAGTNGRAATGTLSQLKLKAPGATTYTTISASRPLDRMTTGGLDYSAYADVTSIVRNAGAGTYWAAARWRNCCPGR